MSREIRLLGALAAGLWLAVCGLPETAAAEPGGALQMTVEQLRSLPPQKVVVLDTRPQWKYLLSHIPGAQTPGGWKEFTLQSDGIPGRLNRDPVFLAEKLRSLGIDPSKNIVIYGDPADKWREDGRFFWMMEYLGFKNVSLLQGGFDAWEQAGLDIERGTAADPSPSALQPGDIRFNEAVYADQDWIRQRLGSKTTVIVDNRERSEYDGATPYGSPRGGHIPGAVHIDWRDFFDTRGRLKPQPLLHTLLAGYGIRPGKEVVVYCTGGVRSAMAYFVFRVLGYPVRNYDGSWWDWSHNPALPIELS